MEFKNNLQKLRKNKNYSQEQLAEILNVSRQSVSKWESGTSYPEMDKIVAIAKVFECSIDDLVTGEIKDTKTRNKDVEKFNKDYKKYSLMIALGVFICIIGVASFLYSIDLMGSDSQLGIISLLSFVMVGVSIFIYNGITYSNLEKLHLEVKDDLKEEDKDKYTKALAVAVSLGVALIIFGIIFMLMAESTMSGSLITAIFLTIVAFAVFLFVYFGMMYSKFETLKAETEPEDGKVPTVIMLSATIIFLISGFIFGLWHIAWIVFPIGALLSAIIEALLK